MTNQTQSVLDIAIDNIDNIVVVCDTNKLIQQVNQLFESTTGYTAEEVLGKNLKILISEKHSADIISFAKKSLESESFQQGEIKVRYRNGKNFSFISSSYIAYDQTGQPCNYVIILQKADKDAELAKDFEKKAYYDELTGLPDKHLFRDHSEQGLILAERAKKSVAVLILGMDRFTIINDGLGFNIGDSLLKSVAQRLKEYFRSSDTVARIEGDRFGIMLQVASADDGVIVAEKLLKAVKQPFNLEDQEVTVTASIGISLYPDDGKDIDVLAKRAESAMRHAKKGGGNQYLFFANNMNIKAKKLIEMESSLRRAIKNKEFVLYYQPKVDVETQKIIGMEALMRWQDPEKGLISPGSFIPVAEDIGLIGPIDSWGLQEACTQNRLWQDKGLQPVCVSVNVSARQFGTADFLDNLSKVLTNTGLPPQYLELEITESMIMDNIDDNILKLQKIRELGCLLSLDDFGTGYSSLSYLTRFPITTLKIDQSFIRDLESNQSTAEITNAIIGMSHGLNLKVIAEGAETVKHIDFLRKHGCNTVQGFYYSRPVPQKEFEELLSVGFIKRV